MNRVLLSECLLSFSLLALAPQSMTAVNYHHPHRMQKQETRMTRMTKAPATIHPEMAKMRPVLKQLEQKTTVNLLDSIVEPDKKELYQWNEFGHLISHLVYYRNDETWILSHDSQDNYTFEYEYAADHSCVRQSKYDVNLDGSKGRELSRVTARYTEDGIYIESQYEDALFYTGADKMLVRKEKGFDSWGNPVLSNYYDFVGEESVLYNSTEYRFSQKVVDNEGNYIPGYEEYMTLYIEKSGQTVQGWKKETVDTETTREYLNYNWSEELHDFYLNFGLKYTFNASHDRIVSESEVVHYVDGSGKIQTSSDESAEYVYDEWKRPIQSVHRNMEGESWTNTYVYADNRVFDCMHPKYITLDENLTDMSIDQQQSLLLSYAAYCVYGPIASFSVYDEDGLMEGSYTYNEQGDIAHASAVETEDNKTRLTDVDFFYRTDGRIDYLIREDLATHKKSKEEYVYSETGTNCGYSDYEYDEAAQQWKLSEQWIHLVDAQGRLLQYIDRYYESEEAKWYGRRSDYSYDEAGQCTVTYYEPNEVTGEWELAELNSGGGPEYPKEYTDNEGYRVTIYETEKYRCWPTPSDKPHAPVDFYDLYYPKAHPFTDDQSYLADMAYTEFYFKNDDTDTWLLKTVGGIKSYWTDDHLFVDAYYEYFNDTETLSPVFEPILIQYSTVDDQGRIATMKTIDNRSNQSSLVRYQYRNDQTLLLDKAEDLDLTTQAVLNVRQYYYSDRMVTDQCTPEVQSKPLIRIAGRTVNCDGPIALYTTSGVLIKKGHDQLAVDTAGMYVVVATQGSQLVVIQ